MKPFARVGITVALLITIFLFIPTHAFVQAAKPRIRKTVTKTGSGGGLSYSSAKLSRGTNSVVVTFLNLDKVKKTSYTLSYESAGTLQGVAGSLVAQGQSTEVRDLYFGTCSKGVCTPHATKNASLTISTTLSSGATYTKRYRIRM
ncbi:MAG: hypothetical protein Q7S76_01785 [bacterium]|nr:hypothetical protein [bacterium]